MEKRSEIIHPINIDINVDSIIINKEIQLGIFVSNTIIQGNRFCHVKILNTTDKDVILENVKFEIEPLKNYVFYNRTSRPKIKNDPERL